jgi:hypothetical protein
VFTIGTIVLLIVVGSLLEGAGSFDHSRPAADAHRKRLQVDIIHYSMIITLAVLHLIQGH